MMMNSSVKSNKGSGERGIQRQKDAEFPTYVSDAEMFSICIYHRDKALWDLFAAVRCKQRESYIAASIIQRLDFSPHIVRDRTIQLTWKLLGGSSKTTTTRFRIVEDSNMKYDVAMGYGWYDGDYSNEDDNDEREEEEEDGDDLVDVVRRERRYDPRDQACKLCFRLEDNGWRGQSEMATRVSASLIRKNSSYCSGCSLLQQGFEQCEKELCQPGAITDINILMANGTQPFSCCRLYFGSEDTAYELIFGHKTPLIIDTDTSTPFGHLGKSPLNFPIQSVKKWIDNCSKSHQHCLRPQSPSLPRRVIDVGHREAFLYETRGEIQPYATLSHCWYDSRPLKTVKANLARHQGRLVWSQLPLAFQQCIEFVRSLGIRYLWIDSLCIVQDDPKEWEIESGRMANVFENSKVTITLHQAGPNQTSFPDTICSFVVPHSESEIQFHLRHVGHYNMDIERSRLSGRGWCFQERLLSTRNIHCLPQGILFECTQEEHCKCDSMESHSHHCSKFKSMFAQDHMSSENWRKMITLYTQKELTYQTDTLPALSGITNRVRGAGQYYGGIWEKTLPYDLLWFSTTGPPNSKTRLPTLPSKHVAPSFLWASIKGRISFVDIKSDMPGFRQTFSIKHVDCNPKGEDPLGELSGGSIILEAPIIAGKFVNRFERPMAADFFIKHCETGQECLWATMECFGAYYIFHPDTLDQTMENLFCVQLFASTDLANECCYGLVLGGWETSESAKPVIKRVGIVASIGKGCFPSEKMEVWMD